MRFWSVLVLALLASCGRTAQQHAGSRGSGGNAAIGTGGTSSGGVSGFGGDLPLACPGSEPPDEPLRLLTDYQLQNELLEIGAEVGNDARLPTPSRLFSEDPDSATLGFVAAQVELARHVARDLSEHPDKLKRVTGCLIEDEAACRKSVIRFVLRRVFRGLGSPESEAELEDLFDQGQKLGGDFQSGIRALFEVALQSPEFLYRFELGRPAADRDPPWAEPTDFELASRLSFLFWDGGPDEVLLSAAEAGQLSDPDFLAMHAGRMLDDVRAARTVARFYRELTGATPPYSFERPASPAFTPLVYELMQVELDQFVVDATFNGAGDYRALFAPVSWLNKPLAGFYGVQWDGGGEQFRRVDLDPARHAGLLTMGAWLSSARSTWTSPTLRGLAVSSAFLCREIPPPPPLVPPLPEPDGTLTTRQRLEQHAIDPVCAACHQLMDPIGLGLEHFDATGRWRDTENNLPIDSSGRVPLDEGEAEFDGAPGLARALIDSTGTRDCYITQWQRFAFGRHEAEVNQCTHSDLREAFFQNAESVQQLMVALTQTESFRYRKVQEGQP